MKNNIKNIIIFLALSLNTLFGQTYQNTYEYDNSVAESFFNTIKTELFRWENFQSRDECELKIFQYIGIFYNRQRRHSSLGYLSPDEFEEKNLS